MAFSSDLWTREYTEASKLAVDITGMILERSSFGLGPEVQHHSSEEDYDIHFCHYAGHTLKILNCFSFLPSKDYLQINRYSFGLGPASALTGDLGRVQTALITGQENSEIRFGQKKARGRCKERGAFETPSSKNFTSLAVFLLKLLPYFLYYCRTKSILGTYTAGESNLISVLDE